MSELEDAKRVKELIKQAMDNWPDVGNLNAWFKHLSLIHTALTNWIKDREDNG